MSTADYLTLFALVSIWTMMGINVFLSIGGFAFFRRMATVEGSVPLAEYPMVSVMVPAHNEGVVIERTLRALLKFDYPKEKYEIIIINDNSSDNSDALLAGIQREHPDRRILILNTDNVVGGKGKSNALNIGFQVAGGSYIAIYDADNTPEPKALRLLVENLVADATLAAVIGKFRTRNRNTSILTRFVNIETLAYQCMHQAGRWFYFHLCTIPGTNFVIRRDIIETMGGWDPQALAEDTEISFRIYRMGYKIRMVPQAVTWEQEPFTLPIWFRQRTRWVMGNLYVMITNFKYVFDRDAGLMRIDVIYSVLVYVLMLSALVCSDIVFILGILGYSSLSLGGLSTLVWVLASVLFTFNVLITLVYEKDEYSWSSVFLIVLMLFSYSKLWVLVSLHAVYLTIKTSVTKKEAKWYKTERSKE
ncbi:MAG TPA: glycosyltransferase [Clostridia bacterium]|nr:glycosyltransferase [Clostridia bacterium]